MLSLCAFAPLHGLQRHRLRGGGFLIGIFSFELAYGVTVQTMPIDLWRAHSK